MPCQPAFAWQTKLYETRLPAAREVVDFKAGQDCDEAQLIFLPFADMTYLEGIR